jgi:hypothetical protein
MKQAHLPGCEPLFSDGRAVCNSYSTDLPSAGNSFVLSSKLIQALAASLAYELPVTLTQ